MIATELSDPLSALPSDPETRHRLRLQWIGWALLAGITAGLLSLAWGVEEAIRSSGCGLLAFHLQRVDPDDSHLQAGLVGAVCGLRSLGMHLPLDNWQTNGLS